MGLESTMVCIDNSDYMRNGDYIPTRLQAQQDAVNLVCHAKMRQHPENNVGLVTLGGGRVLLTLTSDVGRILSRLHDVQPSGNISFLSSIRIAQLALKHRQGKNHKQRIVAFVGSPVECDEKELVKLAKRLKKEKVNVDVVNFGEETVNDSKLTKFIDNINGRDGVLSRLINIPPGPSLSDALMQSPIVAGEDGQAAMGGLGLGSGFGGFDFDPNEDPELALALRVSMEEQRARQEAEARQVALESSGTEGSDKHAATSEEAMLQSALAMSVDPSPLPGMFTPDNLANLDEDQQIAYALQLSLANAESMEVDGASALEKPSMSSDDSADALNDAEFLQGVLQSLPGVDPQSEEIRNAMRQLTKTDEKKDEKNPK